MSGAIARQIDQAIPAPPRAGALLKGILGLDAAWRAMALAGVPAGVGACAGGPLASRQAAVPIFAGAA